MQTKKGLVNVLRATDAFQISQTVPGTWDCGVLTAQFWSFFVERKGSRFLSAFLRCHGEKGGGLQM
jgi:hypothetical protein